MPDIPQPQARPPADEETPETLRRLLAERDLTHRALAELISRRGERLGAASIGNIAARRDRPGPRALQLIAEALGVPPDTFLDLRLARLRRMLDPRDPHDGGVGPETAAENYELIADALPAVRTADRRLADADRQLADRVGRVMAAAARQLDPRAARDAAPQQPPARQARAGGRRKRPPR